MLKNIEAIKKLGIYTDYKKDSSLKDFNKFNLLYGWNGSGKTTISRLFRFLEKKEIPLDYADIKFSISTDSTTINEKNCNTSNENIYVFNNDFINENIDWDEKVNKILLISEGKITETKEYNKLKEEINGNIETKTKGLKKVVEEKKSTLRDMNKGISNSYSSIAKNIKEYFKIIDPLDSVYSSMNKTKIEKYIKDNDKLKEILESNLTEEKANLIIQKMKVEKVDIIKYSKNLIDSKAFKQLNGNIKNKLETIVTAQVIDRLKNNSDISSWVRSGLELRKKYHNTRCEFCGSEITEKRIERLEGHFNDEVEKLKKELQKDSQILDSFVVSKEDIKLDKHKFYKENHNKIEELNEIAEKNIIAINEYIERVKEKITEKIANPFSNKYIEDASTIIEKISNLNTIKEEQERIVDETNKKTESFEEQYRNNKVILFKHRFKEEIKNEKLFDLINEYNDFRKEVEKLDKELIEKEKKFEKLEEELSNETLGAEKFNEKLKVFIGYDELSLKFNQELKGYEIIRKSTGQKAHNLSEGEKTSIAFVYYLIKIKENNNKVEDSIIVIDDPISSFDNNKLFNAYSCITTEFNKCKQLFILTHNFNFFKLLRDWMKRKKDKETEEKFFSIYKVQPVIENGIRKGNIEDAGKSLNQTSEYDFVFEYVYKYKDAELNEATIFNCGNACRKLLEAFLSFKFPSQRNDIMSLLEKAFPEDEKQTRDRVYKFINAYSHLNLIESSEVSDIDSLIAESNGIIAIILNKIEELDREHYKAMIHNANSTGLIE